MDREQELVSLRAKLAARKDRPGFADNVRDLEARVAELEKQA